MTEKVFRAMHKVAGGLHKKAEDFLNMDPAVFVDKIEYPEKQQQTLDKYIEERIKPYALPDEDTRHAAKGLDYIFKHLYRKVKQGARTADEAAADMNADIVNDFAAKHKSLAHRGAQWMWAHKHIPGHGLPSGGFFSDLSTRIGQRFNRGVDDVARGVETTGRTLKELLGTYWDMYAVTPAKKLMSLYRKKLVQVAQKN